MIRMDLTKPGRRSVDAGQHYRVYAHTFACLEIERGADGATAFFQGEDADTLRAELAARHLDEVCADYDHILTID